jgi:hypothetical protein
MYRHCRLGCPQNAQHVRAAVSRAYRRSGASSRLSSNSSHSAYNTRCFAGAPSSSTAADSPGTSKVDTTLADWICANGGSVTGAQLVVSRDGSGGVDRQLLASKVRTPCIYGSAIDAVYSPGLVFFTPCSPLTPSVNPPPPPQDLTPGERIIVVPRRLQVRDEGTPDAQLQALMDTAPLSSGSGRPAWQFKMALQLVAYRLAAEAAGGGGATADHSSENSATTSSSSDTSTRSGSSSSSSGGGFSHAPYIAHLPGVAPGVPVPTVAMRLTPEQQAQLQNPQLAADAQGQAFHCRAFAEGVLAPLAGSEGDCFGGAVVSEELLGWGLALAMSRSFGFRKVGGIGVFFWVGVEVEVESWCAFLRGGLSSLSIATN